jgi:hypothetical protein
VYFRLSLHVWDLFLISKTNSERTDIIPILLNIIDFKI